MNTVCIFMQILSNFGTQHKGRLAWEGKSKGEQPPNNKEQPQLQCATRKEKNNGKTKW